MELTDRVECSTILPYNSDQVTFWHFVDTIIKSCSKHLLSGEFGHLRELVINYYLCRVTNP